ncbi:MAG TPA: Rne/Rng family ribonuclease [Mycobacteriales bacterium]|nr:Rne/Rng family ribonuclease [Mycobacteriales bacterium]
MQDDERTDAPDTPTSTSGPDGTDTPAPAAKSPRKRVAKKAAAGAPPPPDSAASEGGAEPPAKPARRTRKAAAVAEPPVEVETSSSATGSGAAEPARPTRSRSRKKAAPAGAGTDAGIAARPVEDTDAAARAVADEAPLPALDTTAEERSGVPSVLFQAPEPERAVRKRAPRKQTAKATDAAGSEQEEPPAARRATRPAADAPVDLAARLAALADADADDEDAAGAQSDVGTESSGAEATGEDGDRPAPRRRRRGGRGRGRANGAGAGAEGTADDESDLDADAAAEGEPAGAEGAESDEGDESDEAAANRRRRRRRRRRKGEGDGEGATEDDDVVETVVHVREPRPAAKKATGGRSRSGGGSGGDADEDGVRGVKGSTRLEAKRQRRRDGRDTGRRRVPIITESEFLARRESVERVMVVRQAQDRTQIGVLEDGILVEHFVARKDQTSMVGNVYLGKVQNVLPSMEAAFVDIGRGRNAVLYAGEVNYDASALEGRAPRIEQALKSGQSVLVQVTKDPIGHKGARLTSQVSLPGRYMVYVPDGRVSGISRKLPDTERTRLKGILKRLTPEDAGVIIRTAAEGATEEDLERDLNRLHAQWEDIAKKAQTASAPSLIYGEPDVVIRVIRDIFNEDFKELIVSGDDEWDTVDNYLRWVAPDLAERARRWTDGQDVFEAFRIDEQLAKALDRKVHLPSGGSLVIDKTEAMVVVDVNTGKFTGKGGNLEETVTKNNLEAAEEIVRQLRLRDIGGIIVIDFIDMVLESNRDLVLRRLLECLGRDRTRHQVAEVTSLGLVQMTRKRVGQGLLEAFSETCKECGGRGVLLTLDPVAGKRPAGAGTPTVAGSSQNGGSANGGSSGSGSASRDGSANGAASDGEPKKRRSRGGRGRSKSGNGDATPAEDRPGGGTGSAGESAPDARPAADAVPTDSPAGGG